MRALLFNKQNKVVENIRVDDGVGPQISHHDVINWFEAGIQLGRIN